MAGLRSATEILGSSVSNSAVVSKVWPADYLLEGKLSVRRLIERFADAGAELAKFRTSDGPSAWRVGDRAELVEGIRNRLLDPAIMDQRDSKLCGPISVAFALALNRPHEYVLVVKRLFETGHIAPTGSAAIQVDADLLNSDFPAPNSSGAMMNQADWMLSAALRDAENWFWDVDGDEVKGPVAGGLATGMEMAVWADKLMGSSHLVRPPVWPGSQALVDETELLRQAARAASSGRSAFLCVDGDLIKDGTGETEEDVGWVRIRHEPGRRSSPSSFTHSKDDNILPSHWVVLLGLHEQDERLTAHLWSWSSEFVVSGRTSDFCEYLWGVVVPN